MPESAGATNLEDLMKRVRIVLAGMALLVVLPSSAVLRMSSPGQADDQVDALIRTASSSARPVLTHAARWLGTDYSWGGGSLNGPSTGIGRGSRTVGFDCSSYVRFAYHHGAGITLPRVSRQQYAATASKTVVRDDPVLAALLPGDLLFWGVSATSIHHVALYVGGGKMLEEPGTGLKARLRDVYDKDFYAATRPLPLENAGPLAPAPPLTPSPPAAPPTAAPIPAAPAPAAPPTAAPIPAAPAPAAPPTAAPPLAPSPPVAPAPVAPAPVAPAPVAPAPVAPAPVAPAGTEPPRRQPFSATGICGSGYRELDRHHLPSATAFLLVNDSTASTCAVTLKTQDIGSPTKVSVRIQPVGSLKEFTLDHASYKYYAGPVRTAGRCVQWGGSDATASFAERTGDCS